MKILFFSVLALFVLATASAFGLSKYYARYEGVEKQLEASFNYDAGTANAIKHAKAASDMFRAFNTVMNEDMAEEAVIRLGVLNEYIEQVEYPKEQRDTAREIMKDLHNNYAGILAARSANRADAFRIILSFADNRTLIVKNIYNPFFSGKEPKQNIVAFGYGWFSGHRFEIDQRIEKKIARTQEYGYMRQIQLSSLLYNSSLLD